LACPYFMPMEKIEGGTWPHPSRLPLGCGWAGHCTAPGHENQTPSRDILEAFCNLGYASSCTWAPRERAWDAVRFGLIASAAAEGSKPEPSSIVRICYVCERNYRPVERGELEFDAQRAEWVRRHEDARVQKMAECFLRSRLKSRD
jgi:hypothetical protein